MPWFVVSCSKRVIDAGVKRSKPSIVFGLTASKNTHIDSIQSTFVEQAQVIVAPCVAKLSPYFPVIFLVSAFGVQGDCSPHRIWRKLAKILPRLSSRRSSWQPIGVATAEPSRRHPGSFVHEIVHCSGVFQRERGQIGVAVSQIQRAIPMEQFLVKTR